MSRSFIWYWRKSFVLIGPSDEISTPSKKLFLFSLALQMTFIIKGTWCQIDVVWFVEISNLTILSHLFAVVNLSLTNVWCTNNSSTLSRDESFIIVIRVRSWKPIVSVLYDCGNWAVEFRSDKKQDMRSLAEFFQIVHWWGNSYKLN